MNIRTEKQWRALFQQQRSSGLSANQFCRQHKICPKHFSLRKKQLGPHDVRPFVALQIKSPSPVTPQQLPALSLTHSSCSLQFESLPPTEWLVTFLKALS